MSQNQQVYGLIFEPNPTAPQASAAQGRLLTFHTTIGDAVRYYRENRDALLQTYADPAQLKDERRHLPLQHIDQATTRGTMHTIPALRHAIAQAKATGAACLSAQHDATAARPEIYGNEYNKLVMQAPIKFHPVPEATRPVAAPAKKVVRKSVAGPA